LIGKVEAYMEAKIKLATMNVKEEIASVVTRLLPLMILAFVFLLIIIFIGVTLGLLLNYLLQSTWLGFAILTGVYLLFFLGFLWIKNTTWFKKFIKVKVLNIMNQPND
jgi:hypothetical protein